jgi:hypothetical protein
LLHLLQILWLPAYAVIQDRVVLSRYSQITPKVREYERRNNSFGIRGKAV